MRCCSKKVLIGYLIFGLVGLGMTFKSKADEIPQNLYMKLDESIGGYVTLTTERCEIESKKEEYSYKALIETNLGTTRGCWYRPQPLDDNHIPMVLIVEEFKTKVDSSEYISYNIGSFGQYYFKPTKE